MVIMSRLADLLGAREPDFTFTLRELEDSCGSPSADVRLLADINSQLQRKNRELGLDPRDTNGQELYSALMSLVQKHDEFIVKAIGGRDVADVDDILARLNYAVRKLGISQKVWALKSSVAKRLLQKTPPKAVMKQLGYRSADSLLKRCPVNEIYAAIQLVESPQWQRKFLQNYRRLKPSDFEIRTSEIILMERQQWAKAAEPFIRLHRHNFVCLKELGVVAILPLPSKRLAGIGITSLALLLHYINELRSYSSFFKFQQVKPDFGNILVRTLLDEPPAAGNIANQPIHWRVIHRHWGRRNQAVPEIFEPHVHADDLVWRQAEDILYRLEPALLFWQGLDYIGGWHHSRPVSFNLLDAAVNYCNQLRYGQQAVHYLRRGLLDELYSRYLSRPALEQQIVKQLDYQPEGLPAGRSTDLSWVGI